MAVEHVAGTGGGGGGPCVAIDSRDEGGCLSLYVHLKGRLEHLCVCMDKKARGRTDWGVAVEIRTGNTDKPQWESLFTSRSRLPHQSLWYLFRYNHLFDVGK